MSQQKNVNKLNKMASYFDGTPVGLLDANFEEVRKSNSPGFKKRLWSVWKIHINIQ